MSKRLRGPIAVITGGVAAVLLLLGSLFAPGRVQLSGELRGDETLAAAVTPALTGVRDRVAVCRATSTGSRTAEFGADSGTLFPIGSLTKVWTGTLLADAISRGEVRANTRLGTLLDLGDTPVADVTLKELATHTSGLGLWGDDQRDGGLGSWWAEVVLGDTTHDASTQEVLDRARADPLATRGSYSYSNIGIALLGMALAEAADTDYAKLLNVRLLTPLGMSRSGVMSTSAGQRAGHRSDGRTSPVWTLGEYGPAGGGRSSIADMCAFARSALTAADGSALAQAMVADSIDGNGEGTGLGWNVHTVDGGLVAVKTGQVGGYSAMIMVDRDRDRASVVLSDSEVSVESAALAALRAS